MYRRRQEQLLIAVVISAFVVPAGLLAAQEAPGPRVAWSGALTPAPTLFAADEEGDPTRPGFEPALAGGMSVLLPGGGQFYNGQNMKGGLMLAGFAASVVYAVTAGLGDREICAGQGATRVCDTQSHWPNSRFWIGLGSAAGLQAWSIVDAIAVASRRAAHGRDAGLGLHFELGPHLRDGEPAVSAGLSLTR